MRYFITFVMFFAFMLPVPANAADVCVDGRALLPELNVCVKTNLLPAPTIRVPIPPVVIPQLPPVVRPPAAPPAVQPAPPRAQNGTSETPRNNGRAVEPQRITPAPTANPDTPKDEAGTEKKPKTEKQEAICTPVVNENTNTRTIEVGYTTATLILIALGALAAGFLVFYRRP